MTQQKNSANGFSKRIQQKNSAKESVEIKPIIIVFCGKGNGRVTSALKTPGNHFDIVVYIFFEFCAAILVKKNTVGRGCGSLFMNVPFSAADDRSS